jgi:phosphatidylglycerol:prolipoprotein diacylglycerol transferase
MHISPVGLRFERLYSVIKLGIIIVFSFLIADSVAFVNFADLGLHPVAFSIGPIVVRWYALAYLVGLFFALWYMFRLIAVPGAPWAKRHAEDFLLWAMFGVILGGRLGYVLFYRPSYYVEKPGEIIKMWDGGMSFHGGLLGVVLAMWLFARKEKLSFVRLCDYVGCTASVGFLLGRLANFVNGELWGRATDVPWAIIFPNSGTMDPRHPSQLYEAAWEGALMFTILWFLFWKTDARYRPGMLAGIALIIYGTGRFLIEMVREPDNGLENLAWGLTMGQTLTVPMLLIGIFLVIRAKSQPKVMSTI